MFQQLMNIDIKLNTVVCTLYAPDDPTGHSSILDEKWPPSKFFMVTNIPNPNISSGFRLYLEYKCFSPAKTQVR